MSVKQDITQKCKQCGVILDDINWPISIRQRFPRQCLICKRIVQGLWQKANPQRNRENKQRWLRNNREKNKEGCRKWREIHLEQQRQREKENTRQLRKEVIDAYGAQCKCCGEGHTEFLAIDHINGGGNEHRRQLNSRGGKRFYAWLKQCGFPQDAYRILCHNCNQAKSLYKYCPHTVTKITENV